MQNLVELRHERCYDEGRNARQQPKHRFLPSRRGVALSSGDERDHVVSKSDGVDGESRRHIERRKQNDEERHDMDDHRNILTKRRAASIVCKVQSARRLDESPVVHDERHSEKDVERKRRREDGNEHPDENVLVPDGLAESRNGVVEDL